MPTLSATRPRSAWNFFPHALIAGLLVVVLVNAGMVLSALRTFPGVAALDVFDHSNAYDQVLAQAAREAALGWSVQPVGEVPSPVLILRGQDGQPLTGATVASEARRPLGPDMATHLVFREVAPGRYVAESALPALGQWDLRLLVAHAGQTLHATRRIVAK
jgi:nitrogen fixation protein FixH